jgi:hypothetical protein
MTVLRVWIVKRGRRQGKKGGSGEIEMKNEATFRLTKRPIVIFFFDDSRHFVLLKDELTHRIHV